jgi:competence protein ComEA
MSESVRDRLASLSRGELLALVAVVTVTVGGAALWYSRSLPRPVEVQAGVALAAPTGATAAVSEAPGIVLVDVAGWVRRPGVYEFEDGARIVDAVNAAGGARRGAMLVSLNLAAPLVDGSQIYVPKRGEEASVPAPGAAAPGAAPGGTTTLINVNTATATELEALPGIGPVLSGSIVDYRTQNGPFTSVDQLDEVSGIGPVTLEKLRPLVTV